eukprot:gnl/TRDRNA2_/TRDRNA2_200354_c0_seq1.p1 gnl/TRDRNA2_/TRDRNA2_200354_c0~~gnl/TRDRNA2_/TRDRNA2_200354_c0_seq1.p1  ORF type:complete len:260 (-),score=26.44 gnl/TRDRNA2_/TRDRNA2_200354_c0_seq1:49-828(-)
MQHAVVIILFVFGAQAHAVASAEHLSTYSQKSIGQLIDDLVNMVLHKVLVAQPRRRMDLENTTFGQIAGFLGGGSLSRLTATSAGTPWRFPLSRERHRTMGPTSCTRFLALQPCATPQRFPVLSKLQGSWRGSMQYASGDSLVLAPFTLMGSMNVIVLSAECTIESSVVLPNGKKRVVVMRADADDADCIRFTGEGPIDTLVTEVAPDMLLMREIERDSGRLVMSATMQLLKGGELRQIGHELVNGTVTGMQLWTFERN